MKILLAALLAAASCVTMAQAQQVPSETTAPTLTLDQAVAAAGGASPAAEAAAASIEAARAGRTVAGLRPNPQAQVQVQVENIGGTGPDSGLGSAETTVGVALPIELGGTRVPVADAQLSRVTLEAAIVAADIRLEITRLYVVAIAAKRRLVSARDRARIAEEALRAASVRVQAGRIPP